MRMLALELPVDAHRDTMDGFERGHNNKKKKRNSFVSNYACINFFFFFAQDSALLVIILTEAGRLHESHVGVLVSKAAVDDHGAGRSILHRRQSDPDVSLL